MRIARPPAASGVSAPERELACYEALRVGRRDAFARLAMELDPVLRDIALASTPRREDAAALVAHTWQVVLGGLDLFAWRCSLRAWVAGVLTGLAGQQPPRRSEGSAAPRDRGPVTVTAQGPVDWRDLPWGARWSTGVWEALEEARSGLPVVGRQALVFVDVHRWGDRDAADALGLTARRYVHELGCARLALLEHLAGVVGDSWRPRCDHGPGSALARPVIALARPAVAPACTDCAVLAARWGPVAVLLASSACTPPAELDPQIVAAFRRWRAATHPGLLAALARATVRAPHR